MNGRPPEEGDEAAAKQPMMVVNGLLGLQHQAEIYRGSAVEHSSERENIESAARARYNRDLQQARRTLREALRSDLPAAHMGLGVTVIALIVVATFSGPR
jgi:hypothetical protein